MEKISIGILGAGNIAAQMAQTILQMKMVSLYAVAAREAQRAEAFAQKHGIEKAYGSYEQMLSDPKVDLVYIATPHSHHYQHIKMSLEYKKHVLCEKAFTVNANQAKEVICLAERNGLLLLEALWTRFMPFSHTIKHLLASGVIGKITGLTANLGYDVKNKPRLREPSLAGGALLDLGVYPINFASMILGTEVRAVSSCAVMYHTGVDAQDSITLRYENDIMAILYATMMNRSDRQGVIYGEEGFMVVENINNPTSAKIYGPNLEIKGEYIRPPQISGYEYEVEAAIKAIRESSTECPEMPHSETIRIMEMMDNLRVNWGLRYPGLE